MPGQKLYPVGGVPPSPKLTSIRNGVTPEQGNYYDQSIIARFLIPLRSLFTTSRPAMPMRGAGVGATLDAMLRGTFRKTGPVGKVYPTSASEANSPQGVKKRLITRKP